ncbi:MAG: hypothetical protein MI892_12055 [Desulfobacterales bacterium]|nr:hypothetical protein [Desulfobacterales bacterium]
MKFIHYIYEGETSLHDTADLVKDKRIREQFELWIRAGEGNIPNPFDADISFQVAEQVDEIGYFSLMLGYPLWFTYILPYDGSKGLLEQLKPDLDLSQLSQLETPCIITKYNEPYDDLNPEIRAFVDEMEIEFPAVWLDMKFGM